MKLVVNVILSVCIVCAGCAPVHPPQEGETIAVIHDQDLPTIKSEDTSGGMAGGPWEKSKEAVGNLWEGCRGFAYAAPGDPFTLTIFLAGTVICVAATPVVAVVGAIRGVIGEKTEVVGEETEFSGEEAGTDTAPDTTPPVISLTIPSAGESFVPINISIKALFSKAMDAATINGKTFTLNSATGSVTYDTTNHVALFVPSGSLLTNTTYTATITTGVEDLSGNTMANDYVWSFATGSATDVTPPLVSATSPADAQALIDAQFSTAMPWAIKALVRSDPNKP